MWECSVIIIIIPIIFIISNIPPAGSEAQRHRWNMTLIIVATIYWNFSTFSWQQLLPAANNRSAYPEHHALACTDWGGKELHSFIINLEFKTEKYQNYTLGTEDSVNTLGFLL